MTVASNVQALLELVERDAARRIAETRAAALADAARVRREAHASARALVRAALHEERHRHRERVASAQAALDTRRRLAMQARNAALIDAGLQALPQALTARWQNGGMRAAWVNAALAQALAVLPLTAWAIACPSDWAHDEREALARRIEQATGHAPTFADEPGLEAGLAIRAQDTIVDARLPGLLADRARVGARLLHWADAAPAPEHDA